MRKIVSFLLIMFIILVSGCSNQVKSPDVNEIKNIPYVEPPKNITDVKEEGQQVIYSVNDILNKSHLFLNKFICVNGIIRDYGDALYIIDETERKWLLGRLEGKRIKVSKKEIVIDAKYLICGKFSKEDEYMINTTSFTLGGSNRKTNITEEISKLCYYLIPGGCIPESPGGCGMVWEALPLRKPNPCKEDIDCIKLGPSYKNWTTDEVKCKLDNTKACINDEDCMFGGTCTFINGCYNRDYWEDECEYNCEGNCATGGNELYPYSGCRCVNNYCEEVIESQG